MNEPLQVGDIISHVNWDTEYIVLAEENDGYRLAVFNTETGVQGDNSFTWEYYQGNTGVKIHRGTINYKTAVERKIAVMYKRFEQRKNHV